MAPKKKKAKTEKPTPIVLSINLCDRLRQMIEIPVRQDIDIRFVSLDSNEPIAGMKGSLKFQSSLQVVELNLKWRGVVFPAPGEYLVEVLCDGAKISDRKFTVFNPNEAPHTNGTGG